MIFLKKPDGVGEWDGYPMPDVPPNRKPLSKEEEEKVGAELRENIRKLVKKSKIKKEPLYEKSDEQRKIG